MTPEDLGLQVERAVEKTIAEHFEDKLKAPKVLYHYTDAFGFQAIIRSQKLWATHASFMNDRDEIKHAHDLLRK